MHTKVQMVILYRKTGSKCIIQQICDIKIQIRIQFVQTKSPNIFLEVKIPPIPIGIYWLHLTKSKSDPKIYIKYDIPFMHDKPQIYLLEV